MLVLTACGDDDDGGAGTSTEGGRAADLQLSSTEVGDILVDRGGMTVYLFVPDAQGDSTCYDTCEENWPPVLELSTVGDDLEANLLGTTERADGTVQATYGGWPLYRFAADAAPGDTNGQGVNEVWYVIGADGNAIGSG
jgi:predicted lipoprotein with Yx(FWY)xxD motif